METLIPGLILGFLGSMHCLGMCGPLALALPHTGDSKITGIIDSILYNFGRIITYSILGLIFGSIGSSLKLAGLQESLSVIIGAGLLIVYFFPRKWKKGISGINVFVKLNQGLKRYFHKFFMVKSKFSLFIIGLLNGLLPCGLVYVALAASVATEGAIEGSGYMLFFGLGTLPMMFSVYFAKGFISPKMRMKMNKLIPVGVALVAILMIMRGMSLGIPMVSPKLHTIVTTPPCCQ